MSTLSKSLGLSSSSTSSSCFIIEEQAKLMSEKQGIVTILGSHGDRPRAAASLRRTLSADMSSKKWMAQNGFRPMKKIASVEQFQVESSASSSEGEDEYDEEKEVQRSDQFDIWGSIEDKKNEAENKPHFDIWSSILCQKSDNNNNNNKSALNSALYVHPLVKRSASTLSEKSLEICTESLGSETGSDGFSSYPSSEAGEVEEDREDEHEQQQQPKEKEYYQVFDTQEFEIVKYNYPPSRKSPPRSFPPPIPSLSTRDGPSVHIRSRRENGRLVLEAVSVPSTNCFRAERQDGRLLLTFINNPHPEEEEEEEEEELATEEVDELEEEFGSFDEEEEEEEEEEEDDEQDEEEEEEVVGEAAIEQTPKLQLPSGLVNVQRPTLYMNKFIRLATRNSTWPHKFNEIVGMVDDAEEYEPTPLPQSLPVHPRPQPRVARLIPSPPAAAEAKAAASFNAYDYCWRTKKTPQPNGKFKAQEQQQVLFLRGNKAEYLVPLLRGCKGPRRTLDEIIPLSTRILGCFKLNPFEYLNLPFDSSLVDVKKQYRKLSLMVHPDKCKHPQAKEAFAEELRAKRKKQLKKDNASKLKSLVDEGKYEQQYEQSEEFQQQVKLKVQEILTEQEWRRRKMQMRIAEEEGRLKKDEEEQKEMWKRKREHEEQWEGTREQRVYL
ncbi:Fantastic Four domain [Dillenia turbinata]|uniref:Fantastic Four domain n=1 Tax=Dillenia turbinata TaxID=194707 RepID=A0AAN8Z6A8_9MAGN